MRPSKNDRALFIFVVILAVLLVLPVVLISVAMAGTVTDPMAEHHHHHEAHGLRVTQANYTVPDLWLVRDDGVKVQLARELDDGRPQVLNFIYTTCPGICPLMSQVFSEFQQRLGPQRERVHMVSISIDPEQDTPARLRDYAKRYAAGSQWRHYTGSVAASVAAQKAFDAYRGDKMNHEALTLMRSAPGQPWVRIDGFARPEDLMQQYQRIVASADTGTMRR